MDVRREELISAYLDGELNAVERQEAERLLAADTDARTFLEELRGLRGKLSTLPRHQLEPEFAEHVLRLAGQARAAGQRPLAAVGPSQSESPAPERATAPQNTLGAGRDSVQPAYQRDLRRPLIWAGLAIAAALLVMLYSGPQPDTTVAQKTVKHDKTVGQTAEDATNVADAAEDKAGERAAGPRDLQMSPAANEALHGMSAKGSASRPPSPSLEMAKKLEQKESVDRANALAKSTAREKAVDLDGLVEADEAVPGEPASSAAPRKQLAERVARQRRMDEAEAFAKLQNDGTAVFYLATAERTDRRDLNRQLESRLKEVNKSRSFAAPTDEFEQDNFADAAANRTGASIKLEDSQAADGGLELVYAVEGTRQQIAAALDGLQEQPNALRLVAVAPQVAANYGTALRGDYRIHQELSDGVHPAARDSAGTFAAELEAPVAGKAGAGADRKAMALRRASQANTATVDGDASGAAGARIAADEGGGAGDGTSRAQQSASTKSAKRKDDLHSVEAQPQRASLEALEGKGRVTADEDRDRPAPKSAKPRPGEELADGADATAADSPSRALGAAPAGPTAGEQEAAAFGAAEPTAPKPLTAQQPNAADRAPADAEAATEESQQGEEPVRRILLVIRLSPDPSRIPTAASALKRAPDADAASDTAEQGPDNGLPKGAAEDNE